MSRKSELLSLYDLFPFHEHPLWKAISRKELDYAQVINAEVQHWIRTRAGAVLRENAMRMAETVSAAIFEQFAETYLEECTNTKGPSHFELIQRLVTEGGKTIDDLERSIPTPGNSAAIALYREISTRGSGCHMLGAGAVEYFYSQLSPQIFRHYTELYEMSPSQAHTYAIHGTMDQVHADRAFSVLEEAIQLHGWEQVNLSVRDAFVATSLHYDGMLQAAVGENRYWNGRSA